MAKRTEIWTIYGQIEAMVATEMGFHRIQVWDVPASQKFNEFGVLAKFAVVIPGSMLPEYERRVALLRS